MFFVFCFFLPHHVRAVLHNIFTFSALFTFSLAFYLEQNEITFKNICLSATIRQTAQTVTCFVILQQTRSHTKLVLLILLPLSVSGLLRRQPKAPAATISRVECINSVGYVRLMFVCFSISASIVIFLVTNRTKQAENLIFSFVLRDSFSIQQMINI